MNRTVATRWTAIGAVLVVAAVAAVVSYSHMQHLAEKSGEEWRSYLIPLSVDGMLVASTLAIVDRRRAGLPAGWVPWMGLSLGILASLAANVAAARPDPIARIIAAWPPLAFAVAVETLVIVLRGTRAVEETGTGGRPAGKDEGERARAGLGAQLPSSSSAPPKSTTGAAAPASAPVVPKPVSVAQGSDEKPPGRRRLARDLGISEHQAREMLRQGKVNGHKVLEDA